MEQITIIGGGLSGLIAAIECAEQGAPVRLLEARTRLGGRAASAAAPYIANLGPHALYTGGSLWDWLVARSLDQPCHRPALTAIRFRWRGEISRTPPAALARAIRLLRSEPPNDQTLRAWVTEHSGAEAADAVAGLAGNLTFDHDPGRLAADFVWPRIRRISLALPPVARYVVGGWSRLVERLADRARSLGVAIETGAKVDAIDDIGPGPVVVAVEPGAARRLLADPTLRSVSPAVALVDVALEHRRGDPYLVLDLDEAAFVDRFTTVDPSLAPPGEELVQASVGLRPGEDLATGVVRIEAILDAAFADWRGRVTWRRRAVVRESTGAIELPGSTWRDRPPVRYRPGVWLAGDWVAAPGHLAEVGCASAIEAAAEAVAWLARARAGGSRAEPSRPRVLAARGSVRDL